MSTLILKGTIMKLLGVSTVILSIFSAGCASILGFGYTKAYQGPALPDDQIAIIEKHPKNGFGMGSGVSIDYIDDQEISSYSKTMLEVTAGDHVLKGTCDTDSKGQIAGNNIKFIPMTVSLEAGHHYKVGGYIRHLPRNEWYNKRIEHPLKFLGQKDKFVTITKECDLRIKKIGKISRVSEN